MSCGGSYMSKIQRKFLREVFGEVPDGWFWEEYRIPRNLKQIERDELDQIKSLCENCNAYQEREEKEMSV